MKPTVGLRPICGPKYSWYHRGVSRYLYLRETVATLALSPEKQVAHLDSTLGHLTENGDATCYGNDELAMEFGDILLAATDMIQCGELRAQELEAMMPLDSLLRKWSGEENIDFWIRSALFDDPRWDEVRAVAKRALDQLPKEARELGHLTR